MINRELVKQLQNAHADHIEHEYRQLMLIQDNSKGIEIIKVGNTRIFLSSEKRLENRAIFTGNETEEEFTKVFSLFNTKGITGYFELNPANYYRTDPFSWNSEVLPIMLNHGCVPAEFRCVWYIDDHEDWIQQSNKNIKIKKYLFNNFLEYTNYKFEVESVKSEKQKQIRQNIQYTFTQNWQNYVGFEGRKAVSTSKLFVKDNIGYLAWGFTQKKYRRRGHHTKHIIMRVTDAFAMGCKIIFTVTDFNIPSSLSLQKCGFKLAYNYLLLERDPEVLNHSNINFFEA